MEGSLKTLKTLIASFTGLPLLPRLGITSHALMSISLPCHIFQESSQKVMTLEHVTINKRILTKGSAYVSVDNLAEGPRQTG